MDVLVVGATKNEATRARGHGVLFGTLDPDGVTLPERTIRRRPTGRACLPEGDFRGWEDTDARPGAIAHTRSGSQPADPEPDGHVLV